MLCKIDHLSVDLIAHICLYKCFIRTILLLQQCLLKLMLFRSGYIYCPDVYTSNTNIICYKYHPVHAQHKQIGPTKQWHFLSEVHIGHLHADGMHKNVHSRAHKMMFPGFKTFYIKGGTSLLLYPLLLDY